MTNFDYFILLGLVFSLGLGIWSKNSNSHLGAKTAVTFLLILLAQYQNCTPASTGGFITAASSKCSKGQLVDLQGNCVGASGQILTIDSPSGLQSLSMSGALIVIGKCTLILYPMITATLYDSSNSLVAQAQGPCTFGGNGQFTISLSQNTPVVTSAGSYKLSVTATPYSGPPVVRFLTFTAGALAPVINGSAPLMTVSYGPVGSPQAMELAYPTLGGGPAQITGTCDGANTFNLQLHRKGLGPTSDPTDQTVVTQPGCSNGNFSLLDNQVANNAGGSAPSGYNNYTYSVAALDSSNGTSGSNLVAAFVRPLPKDINNDDIQRILTAMASIFSVSYQPSPNDRIFPKLSNDGNKTYGLFQAACDIVTQNFQNNPVGSTATYYVCSNLGMQVVNNGCADLTQFDPANNRIWEKVKIDVIQQGAFYLLPQRLTGDSSGNPIMAIPATACP